MILAAGFGTRLWPLTIGRTKPALPFLNRPLIGYGIEYLRNHGFTELIINLHHEPESVREQIGDGASYGVRIEYSIEEPEILGTSGALDAVRERLSGGHLSSSTGRSSPTSTLERRWRPIGDSGRWRRWCCGRTRGGSSFARCWSATTGG
jgi:hypothetical protein